MTEWVMIFITSSSALIKSWDGHNISHVRGYKSKQHCEADIRAIKKEFPKIPKIMRCVHQRDIKSGRRKPS